MHAVQHIFVPVVFVRVLFVVWAHKLQPPGQQPVQFVHQNGQRHTVAVVNQAHRLNDSAVLRPSLRGGIPTQAHTLTHTLHRQQVQLQ